MLENTQKDWHGCYSRIGKNSIEQFTEIMNKDEIFKRAFKTVKVKDFFSPDKEINKLDYLEDNLKVFQKYENEIKKLLKDNNNEIKNTSNKLDTENNKKVSKHNKFKYHDLHIYNDKIKKLKRIDSIPNFVYKPKYDLIFSKTVWGLQWKKMKGRQYPKINIDNRKYLYDEKKTFLNESGEFKCRVNMDKSTKRGDFLDLKNIRIRSDKAYNKEKKNKKNKCKIKMKLIKSIKNFNFNNNSIEKNNKNFKSLSTAKNSETDINNVDSPLILTEHLNKINGKPKSKYLSNKNKILSYFGHKSFKNRKNLKNKENISTNRDINIKTIDKNNQKYLKPAFSAPKIRGPDFKKNITRKYLEKLRNLHLTTFLISNFDPNYSLIKENHSSYVKYIDENKKNKNRKKIFVGMEPNFNYDANKDLDKYNNHMGTKAPIFNLMSSRYSKKNFNLLPCYMQNLFQRGNQENLNEKMLELNMYSNRGLSSSKSSFFPKKSFNNIINLNLINSSIFRNNIKNDEVKEKIELIKNEINFNHKGYEELIKEGALKRFDGVTFKTINRKKDNLKMIDLLYK